MDPLAQESSTKIKEIESLIRERLDLIVSHIRQLVEIESPSGDETGSRDVVSLLEEAANGIRSLERLERIPIAGYGEHLRIGFFKQGQNDLGSVVLLGHTDTVHDRGSLAERPVRIDGGCAFGPGIFDMKANCVMALEAIRALDEFGIAPRRPIILLLTCDEETGSATGRALVEDEARKASAVLVLEPPAPGGIVKTGRKGTGMFSLEAHGIASHAGLDPEKGASAILELARQIQDLHAMNDFAKGTTVNVGVVRGGTRSNVVAENANAEIDIRFTSNDEGSRIAKKIIESRSYDSRVRLKVTGGINRPPLERNARTVGLFEAAREIAMGLGFELNETQVGGASDGNFAAAVGAAVLDGLGIDGDGAHAAHEHILIDDIPRRTALLAGLLATL